MISTTADRPRFLAFAVSLCVSGCGSTVVITDEHSTGGAAGTGNTAAGGMGGSGGQGASGDTGGTPECGPITWGSVPVEPTGAPLQGDGLWQPVWARSLNRKTLGDRSYVAADAHGDFIWAGVLRTSSLCGAPGPKEIDDHAFVAKLNAEGALVWLTPFTGGQHGVLDVAVEGDRIAVGGYFSGSIDFEGTTLAHSVGRDGFVVVLDSNGSPLWARKAEVGQGEVNGLSLDPTGGLAIIGTFDQQVDWGTGPILSGGTSDMFVAHLDPSGAPTWVRTYGNEQNQFGASIARGATGDLVALGMSWAPLDLGTGGLIDRSFLVKLDPVTGQDLWVKPLADDATQIAPAPDGGYFVPTSQLDGTFGLSKVDEDGATVFEHHFQGTPIDGSVASKPVIFGDRVAVSVGWNGTIDLGGGALDSGSAYEIVIGVFDLDGGFVSSLAFGHAKLTLPWSLASSGHRMILTGGLLESLDLGFTTVHADPFEMTSVLIGLSDGAP